MERDEDEAGKHGRKTPRVTPKVKHVGA